MGLGAAGVLGWQTAVAFSLGADLGTTITSWIASLNLSKNAKRAAYAHIAFNIIGVAVMLPLFFPAMQLLTWAMGWFGGDPGVPVIRDGHETFPLVPVAVGVYSTAFNVFNTILLFPFVGVFERVLSRVGREATDAAEDYSVARFLDPTGGRDLATGVPLVQQEMARYVEGAALFLVMARREKPLPGAARDHQNAIDILSRDIRRYHGGDVQAGHAARAGGSPRQPDRRRGFHGQPRRKPAPGGASPRAAAVQRRADVSWSRRRSPGSSRPCGRCSAWRLAPARASPVTREEAQEFLAATRERCLAWGADLPWEERGAILELLGSAERALFLIARIIEERRSVPRAVAAPVETAAPVGNPGLAPA